jgi:hypothetical protein
MEFIINCPHCYEFIIITNINCNIFRHATLISNGNQIDPHTTKEICDNLILEKKIYGCGKPFQIIEENGIFKAIICNYI